MIRKNQAAICDSWKRIIFSFTGEQSSQQSASQQQQSSSFSSQANSAASASSQQQSASTQQQSASAAASSSLTPATQQQFQLFRTTQVVNGVPGGLNLVGTLPAGAIRIIPVQFAPGLVQCNLPRCRS
jgi:hypothetical protein